MAVAFLPSATMTWYVTEIKALDKYGELQTWIGPNVPGINKETAQEFCDKHMGYCKVIGRLVSEIPCDENYVPDYDKMVDYDKINMN